MSTNRILVTGGAGFIGSHVVDALLARGRTVRILDVLEKPTHLVEPKIPDGVEFLREDIRSRESVARAVDSMDAVVHLAATGGFTPDISRYMEVNSVGTALLVEESIKAGVKKIVAASSVGIYGEGSYRCADHGVRYPEMRSPARLAAREWDPKCPDCDKALEPAPTGEENPAAPEKPYSISKYDTERLVLGCGIPAVALRFFLTYGPRQSLTNPYTGVASIFSSRLLNDLPPILFEDGRQLRDFVYVGDVAAAVMVSLEKVDGGVFNVGTGKGTSIRELASMLGRLYKKSIEPVLPGEYRPGEARHIYSDNAKLRSQGWKPTVDLESGLRRYMEWVSGQGDVKEYFTQAQDALKKSGVIRNS